jgi:hypothetical protein
METADTVMLTIRCAACETAFRPRAGVRLPWRRRSVKKADGGELAAYMCGKCEAGFSGEPAVLDFLDNALERQGG